MTTMSTMRSVAATALAGALTACSGGVAVDAGSRAAANAEPMPLDNRDAVIRAVAATIQTAGLFGLGNPVTRPTGDDPNNVTTEDCGSGGQIIYDDPARITTADSCREQVFDSTYITIDGRIDEVCGGDADQCVRVGSTQNPLTINLEGDYDDTFELTIDIHRSTSGTQTTRDRIAGAFVYTEHTPDEVYASTSTDDFAIDQTLNEDDVGAAQIDGSFVFSSSENYDCTSGAVTVSTPNTLLVDTGEPYGGQLTLDNSAGDSAAVEFADDGSFNYTLANGEQGYVSWDELYNVCGYTTYSDSSSGSTPGPSCSVSIAGVCVLSLPAQAPLGGLPL